jgi:hypothetical protein
MKQGSSKPAASLRKMGAAAKALKTPEKNVMAGTNPEGYRSAGPALMPTCF